MENDIIAAHIVCTQGGRVVPAFRLQRSEAVDQKQEPYQKLAALGQV